ncbi:OmpP1/FadL family transporter [Acinetobacter sp. DSM 11652]|uniref:OmpP1/FadL family transporter n=1 Tax=Acinetobacter sp. DSM 11652 TaxID=346222 RepID=UPI0008C2FFEB|nr:outer membrane protein transport protein [Acinetobacter sp. DSM 11652]SEL84774.1 long-chain fatty acid transport protein [Acinetobacter sp. DSM 11652]
MKLKTISASVLFALLPISGAYAAAMDRSGQSIGAFLQPNNYFEAGISIIDPDVSGKNQLGPISDMAEDYYFPSAALKLQLNEKFSFGLLYDQPFGASAYYTDGLLPGLLPDSTLPLSSTEVKVNSNNISAIVGFQPNENLNIYGGGVYQDVRGNLTLSSLANYQAHFKRDEGYGWLAGVAYQIPEIALKASLTYRSEIDHSLETTEDANGLINAYSSYFGYPSFIVESIVGPQVAQVLTNLKNLDSSGALNTPSQNTKISTPQSVNLDFQTGIMANTVAFANVRWVEWGGLKIDIDKFRLLTQAVTSQGQNIIEYDKDQWSATVGVGRKINEKWGGALSAGWDSGAGNPVTALGPTEGYWNLGLSAQFSPTPATFIGGGVKYFWLGDADGRSVGREVGKFEDNNAWAYGLKIGYRF